MAYCHECGEEVAEIDVFCPFCGISLNPVAVPDDTDVSLENTVAINHSEIAKTLDEANSVNKVSASAEKSEKTVIEQSEIAPDIASETKKANDSVTDKTVEEIGFDTDNFSNPLTEENINLKTEQVEIPANLIESKEAEEISASLPEAEKPVFLRDSGESSSEEQPADDSDPADNDWNSIQQTEKSQTDIQNDRPQDSEKQSETILENSGANTAAPAEPSMPSFTSNQNEYFRDISDDSVEESVSEASLTDSALDDFVQESSPETENESESSMMAYQESEIKELNEVEEIETPADKDDKNVAGETDSAQTDFDYLKQNYTDSHENAEPVSEQPEVSGSNLPEEQQEAESFEEPSAVTLEDEDKGQIEPSIAKPDFDFEPEDTPPGMSRFDSVRIMESSEESADEPAKINFQPEPAAEKPQSELSDPKEPQKAVAGVEESSEEPRSYTTPNIGVTDTDGKKSKLKPLDEGTILNGRYEIVRKIGGGGMGAVYLASDKNLGGVLRAVKEMVQSYIEETQQEKAVNDFKRESMLLTSLEHPAIPTIFDYFYDEKEARFYLVMKYINGGDLSSRLRSAPEGKIDETSVVEWAIQIADVLDYLHKRQPPIVYRDLKPANIMIDGNTGRIMLIDFGIARWINKEEKGVTAVGTMGYAPPELFSGNVEARSDIYSLGSTMFHLLTGADPQSNPLLIFDFQKNPRPRQINPQLSDQIERILMRAVEYNAEKRFASAAEMRRALEEHLVSLKGNQVTFGVKETPKVVTLSDQKVFCGFCGQSIVASDLFCAFCGAKQPIAQKGVHAESYAPAPLTAKLIILGTNEHETPSYMIEKDNNLVGRRDPMSNIFPEVDLSKFDPQTKISRRHARIWRDGNKFMVEDLGSSNGTVLMPVINEAFRLVPNQPHILTSGDKLKLGDTTLHFVIG